MTNVTVNAEPAPDNHNRRILLIVIVIMGVIFAIVGANAISEKSTSYVVAVNDQIMTQHQFEAEIALQEVKYELTGRDQTVDKPVLLNRLIDDMLLLEAAAKSGVNAPEAVIQDEIDSILARHSLSRVEMSERLSDHDLTWMQFENSVQDYMTITRYVDEQLLAEVSLSERKEALDEWMSAQYQSADMRFDQDFLDSINASPSDLTITGSNG